MKSICALLYLACGILLPSCVPYTIKRQHDLQPGELRGTVFVGGSDKIGLSAGVDEVAVNNRIADILSKAGLTRVMNNTGDWCFIWFDNFLGGEIAGVRVSNGYASIERNYVHKFKGFLYQKKPTPRQRWTGDSWEVWGYPGNGSTIGKRIDRLMVPFPGVPLRKEM